MPNGLSTSHLFRPKIAAVLAGDYCFSRFRKDAIAGLTVAVVALPLSMAIAVASGVAPERGLYSAIIGGALVSALGGSRFQIGGPAGAFIVLVATTVGNFGVPGLLLTVFLSGLLLTLLGLLKVGSLIRLVPHAVTVGFTCGIAAIILASQLKDLLGLRLPGAEPGPLLAKARVLAAALPTLTPLAALVGLATAAIILALRRWRPLWPGMMIAVALGAAVTNLFHFPIDTIGSRFGEIPGALAAPLLPAMSWREIERMLPSVFSFTLLGGIESLLSAKVADGMTGRVHRANMELVAQGIANVAAALFGGISVTGTIARTATNIRAGAQTPLAGIMHAGFLLAFMLLAAPLASFIPMPSLAGILVVVAWNMADGPEMLDLLRHPRSAAVFLATFLSTLIWDLTIGIALGCLLACLIGLLDRAIRRS